MGEKSGSQLAAYVVPFLVFMGGLALAEGVRAIGASADNILLSRPEYWVYPLQTLLCGAVLVFYWKRYDFGRGGGWLAALAAGIVSLAIWLSPQLVFGVSPRLHGFDPTAFESSPGLFWLTVAARFARLVVVVPLVEEIFWRGFLMRYLIRDHFAGVPLGAFSPLSFFGVAGLFMFAHGTADWPAAFSVGLIYNGLLVWTKNLGACVAAHATTNLGLGVYIMVTRQWGFW